MQTTVPFSKMSGAGNDFVVIDNREGIVPEPAGAFAARVCARAAAVGADGLLLLEKSASLDFRMRYFNADGSEAEMCGNGARCISRFALLIGAAKPDMRFETLAGEFRSRIDGAGIVRLDMTAPRGMALNLKLVQDGREYEGHFLNTGVPHLVLEWPDLEAAPVLELGRKLRNHARFAPQGANVNFALKKGPSAIRVRTYERGVEDETLACGTGAVASAILMARLGRVAPPVVVTTKSGSNLTVRFKLEGDAAANVVLEGEAIQLYSGSLNLGAFGY